VSLQPGDKLGAFRLVKELGRGATGIVFLAEQSSLGRECALKILAPELVRDKTFLDRFRREGQIAASLRHKNIVRIFDLLEEDGNFAIAMDYIEGQELRDLLQAQTKLPQDVALDIISHVLDALEYAHVKGIVHRDIKPANIMIERDGSVFLTDFSIARMAGTEKLTKTGMVIGTPEYMAPEQFDGKDVDSRADVYATALILYELLSGQNPFAGDTLAEIIKKQVLLEPPSLKSLVDVPDSLVEVVHKGLRKSPAERYQTAGEMREALLTLGQPIQQSQGSLTQFLSSVELGAISMDEAVIARDKVKDAIDRGFKRRLTIVMLDLAGSSKIKIPNQTLVADRAFQDYRGTINRILESYQVERYDWSGDGAISLFPEPISAVDAAVMVQRTVAEVGERHQSLPDALKVRIGIRTGLVYYDPRRTLGEFASRTVDQAGHLEKDCPPGSIRLGDETVKALGDRYSVISQGQNRDDIEVFELDVYSAENKDRFYPAPSPNQAPVSSSASTNELESSEEGLPESAQAPKNGGAPPKDSRETVSVASNSADSGTGTKELFRPKSGSVERKPETVSQDPDERMPWWGWKSLAGLFLAWASVGFVSALAPGLGLQPLKKLFLAGFGMHLMLTPFYCFYRTFKEDDAGAKEAFVAFGTFAFVGIVFGLVLAGLKSL
jgi:serine/threonine protein kinase